MIDTSRESNERHRRLAMGLRRWFLILATPVILFLTVTAVLQWQAVWRWFAR